MSYNPMVRGLYPVGVRTIQLRNRALAARPVPVELWYPATDAYRTRDLDDAFRDRFMLGPGLPITTQKAVRNAEASHRVFPLAMYFHGGYGHQLECTHLCTHLASHGYVVAAPAFPGDNIADLTPGADGSTAVAKTPIDRSAAERPRQAALFIEHLVSRSLGLPIDPEEIGTIGFSMGGFTALAVNSVSRRPRATFAMCPMWGQRSMVPQVRRLAALLHVDDWRRPVATCLLTGDVDPMVNVEDMRLLYRRLATPKRLFVLGRAGHLHWADGAEAAHERYREGYLSGSFPDPEIDAIALGRAMRPFAELCTEEDAGGTARGLCVAQMDADLKGNGEARVYLDGDVTRWFESRGLMVAADRESFDQTVTI